MPANWTLQRKPVSAALNVVWLVIGAILLGFIYPVPALICWIRAHRLAPKMTMAPARAWMVWAIVFSVLSLGTYGGLAIALATGGGHQASTAPPPDHVKAVHFGTTVRFVSDAGIGSHQNATITLRASRPVRLANPTAGGATVEMRVQVCATSTPINPLLSGGGVFLGTSANPFGVLPVNKPLPPSAYFANLPPHHCLAANFGYHLASGAEPTMAIAYGGAGTNVVWALDPAQARQYLL